MCRLAEAPLEQCRRCGNERKLLARGLCPGCYRTDHRDRNGRPSRQITCAHCGKHWSTKKWTARFCSLECAQRNAAGWVHSTNLARIRPPRIWHGQTLRSGAGFVSGPCTYCGSNFTGNAGSKYCSDRCSANASWKRRYARRGEFAIERRVRFAIYARDNFVCQICMESVDMQIPTQDRMGHTLDHIIPQSHQLVPDHSASNLRLAHRLCNSIRGDRA